MNKPKPLDLDSEEIEELVIHKLKNIDTVIINVDEVPDIRTAIRVTTEEIKQRIKSASVEFIKELGDAFNHADVDDTIWYDDMTTLYEEIVIRFERIFGEVDEYE